MLVLQLLLVPGLQLSRLHAEARCHWPRGWRPIGGRTAPDQSERSSSAESRKRCGVSQRAVLASAASRFGLTPMTSRRPCRKCVAAAAQLSRSSARSSACRRWCGGCGAEGWRRRGVALAEVVQVATKEEEEEVVVVVEKLDGGGRSLACSQVCLFCSVTARLAPPSTSGTW